MDNCSGATVLTDNSFDYEGATYTVSRLVPGLGVVSLLPENDPPAVGDELRAVLLDPDGGVSGLSWTLQRSSDGETWETIAGATG